MHMSPEYLKIQMPSMPWPGGNQHPNGRTVTVGTDKEVLYEVSPSDPIRYRKAVEKIAYFFRREFGYDFPPYHTTHPLSYAYGYRSDIVFMWVGKDYDWSGNKKAVAYGACGFVPEDGHGWCLEWVWLHPYERRRRHLSNAWPYFRERFGPFFIQPPLSFAMKEFLRKHEYNTPEVKEIG